MEQAKCSELVANDQFLKARGKMRIGEISGLGKANDKKGKQR